VCYATVNPDGQPCSSRYVDHCGVTTTEGTPEMRLSGRRLTMALSTLLIVVVAMGATAAWSFGRHREDQAAVVAGYQPGPIDDRSVRLSDHAGAHPEAAGVRAVLQRYFDAINNRDYRGWVGTVARAQSAPQTELAWARDYATTVDSNLQVMTIADDPLRARMMFTSEQAVELAPKSLPVTCINWDVTYLLGDQDGQLVLTGIDPSAQSMTACG
jgi:hypothetical protein